MGSLFGKKYPLHDALREGKLEKVKELLDKKPQLLNDVENTGLLPVHVAALSGGIPMMELLLQKGAGLNDCDSGKAGNTPLFFAANSGQKEMVEFLLARGADVKKTGVAGLTAMHGAAYQKSIDMVKLLEAHGADINAGTTTTPFDVTVINKDLDTAAYFLARGANVDTKRNTTRQLFLFAAEAGRKEIVETLVKRGIPLDIHFEDGLTALHMAACNGFLEIAGLLLEKGAPVDAAEPAELKTPLHYAVYKNLPDMVALLISKGANVNAKLSGGGTALHVSRSADIAGMLLNAGAGVNARTNDGVTPLLASMAYADARQVEVLLEWGADPKIGTGNPPMTPLTLAKKGGRRDVSDLIEQFASGARKPAGGSATKAPVQGPSSQAAPGYKPSPQAAPGYKPADPAAPGFKPRDAGDREPSPPGGASEQEMRQVMWEKEKGDMHRLEREKDPTDYESLLKELVGKLKKNDQSVDFTLLRKAYSRSPLYSPYDSQRIEDGKMVAALGNQGQWEKLLEVSSRVFSYNPVAIDAHYWSAVARNKTGNPQYQAFHTFVYTGLLKSIRGSGDGTSRETAFRVITISEEYALLESLEGITILGRKKEEDEKSSYDVFEVQGRDGRKGTLYFNIDEMFYH